MAYRGATVVDDFRVTATVHPHTPAVIGDGQELTYAELAAAVDAVAQRVGQRPGVVAVRATHSPATIAGLLGVWAAGGTYCPVDPAFPPGRRDAMMAAAGCQVLFDPLTSLATRVEKLADGAAEETDQSAYVLFTSGSTGQPKPVLTPHRAIMTVVGCLRELFALTPADRVLQFASLNWDTSLEEILPTLTSGACLVCDRDAHSGSFPRFLRMIDRTGVSVLDLPTAFWHELVLHLREDRAVLPECVRLVIIGGESVNAARLADWCALDTSNIRLVNTYGCTETTLITHAIDLHGPQAEPTRSGPQPAVAIGWPLPHVRQRVNEEGELLIGGPALASGYRGLPPSDARFLTIDGQRYFRTGDRVRQRHDGALVHVGRVDDEVKVRGVRVDPAEVEAHIAAHPHISAVAVTGEQLADHTVLAAYVVPRPRADPAGLDVSLRNFLRDRLPAHLIPSRICVVAGLAYTPSGKVDRNRIKEAAQ